MSQDASTFHTHRNLILPYYPKEPVLFTYLRQYPSLLKNPHTDSYQDNLSHPPSNHIETLSRSDTSIKTIPLNLKLQPYPTYQNLSNSTSFIDNLYDTFDSIDSDFEMLQNHTIYYSNSSSTPSFPQLYPRVADSPKLKCMLMLIKLRIFLNLNFVCFPYTPSYSLNLFSQFST